MSLYAVMTRSGDHAPWKPYQPVVASTDKETVKSQVRHLHRRDKEIDVQYAVGHYKYEGEA